MISKTEKVIKCQGCGSTTDITKNRPPLVVMSKKSETEYWCCMVCRAKFDKTYILGT